MQQRNFVFSSESVSDGHPDKLCDQISDALLDYYLAQDPHAHVAIETLATTNRVILAGEVTSTADVSTKIRAQIVREVVRDVGYEQEGFHWETIEIEDFIHAQSCDIAQGVNRADAGAGDQGIMFGYATNETLSLMPAPLHYAHLILKRIREANVHGLLPDAKTQLSVMYEGGEPVGLSRLVLSIQHAPHLESMDVRELVYPHILATLPRGWMCPDDAFHVNPTGRFVIGGPAGDTGLTGRKIIVDTYGGAAPHGGGAFSGKDPTKVDRSAAYMMRYIAKNIVAAGLAKRCTVQISYAIGLSQPMSFCVNTHNTGLVDETELERAVQEFMDLSPSGICSFLQLAQPIYRQTAAYGHFGRTPTEAGAFSWESISLAQALQNRFSIAGTVTYVPLHAG